MRVEGKMKIFKTGSLLVVVIFLFIAQKSQVITGRVIDFDSPGGHIIGLRAVKVKVLNNEQKVIELAQSNDEGYYELSKVKIGDNVVIEHYLERYVNYPEKLVGVIRDSNFTVTLARETSDQAYNASVAQNIAQGLAGLSAPYPALEYEWKSLRHFNFPIEQRQAIKQQVAIAIAPTFGGQEKGEEVINRLDADYTIQNLDTTDQSGALRIAREEGILRDIYFEQGTENLTSKSMQELKILASFFKALPGVYSVIITGEADISETNGAPRSVLANKRATVVRDYLIQEGVNPSRLGIGVASVRKSIDSCEKECRKVSIKVRRYWEQFLSPIDRKPPQ